MSIKGTYRTPGVGRGATAGLWCARSTSSPSRPGRFAATTTDLEAARAAVHDATPEGWYVGRPMEHTERNEWSQFAFDPSETPVVGKRSREWTAVGPTELRCVQEMARCLGELREGRWPK